MSAECGAPGILLFSDISVDPKLKVGFGAYLAITQAELDSIDGIENDDTRTDLLAKLKVKQFAATSSTQLEIETILWALEELMRQQSLRALANNLTLYTDSQGIIELPRRRAALEESKFISASGKALNQAGLYRAFYQLQDALGFNLIKLKGHRKGVDKTRLDRVFSYVDKAARKALREYLKTNTG